MKFEKQPTYDASSIKVLKGLEAVRVRPGMYIGNTDEISGLHHMVYEVVDNAIDEALAGYCRNIIVDLHRDGSVSVEDDGRGMPVDMHDGEKLPAVEVIMTQLHAGGKFSQDTYKVSGGLHGVGVSVVNALSEWTKLIIWKNKKEYTISFKRGITDQNLKEIGKTSKTGTKVQFMPDPTIFSNTVFEYDGLRGRFRELAFLNPGVKITFRDLRDSVINESIFYDEGGVESFAKYLCKKHSPIIQTPFIAKQSKNSVEIETAILWVGTENDYSVFFTNTIPQKDGGTHVSGLRTGITKAFQSYAREKAPKHMQKISFTGDEIREGMVCVLSVKVADPKFSSQTKEKLVSSEVRQAVEQVITKKVGDWLEENPGDALILLQKIIDSVQAKDAARKAKALFKKKKGNEVNWQVSKSLAACADKNPENCELYIVEGDSAGGSAKQARNRLYQAVLPLRGKILNIEKSNLSKMLNSDIISTLVATINTGIGVDFDSAKLRYHKVIIMTDADVDGKHIQALLMVFFYRYMRKLIEDGYIYIATPPLYGATEKKDMTYLRDEKELIKYLMNRGLKNMSIKDVDGNIILKQEALVTLLISIDTILESLIAYPSIYRHAISAKLFSTDYSIDRLREYMQAKSDYIWTVEGNSIVSQQNGIEIRHIFDPLILKREDRYKFETFSKAWDYIWSSGFYIDKYKIEDPFEMLAFIKEKGKEGITIQRFKGLGEMMPEQLQKAIMAADEQSRYYKLKIEDVEADYDQLCADLMGDSVAARRQFIEENAKYAEVDV